MEQTELLRAAAAAQWFERLHKSSNEIFIPLYFETKRYLVLMGGGGSGKSFFAGRKLLERLARERGHRALVLRKVARTLRESCFRQLEEQIRRDFGEGWKISRTEMSITAPNGNQIVFAGLDDVEKLKSIFGITMVWIEEASEISESDFNQIDIRVRGESPYYKQIMLSFNPISVSHWLKRRFFDKNDSNAAVSVTTYRDNRFLDEAAIRVLEAYRETDKYFYSVYALGQWGVSGKSVFDSEKLSLRLRELAPPIKTGDFMFREEAGSLLDVGFEEQAQGSVKIFLEPKPHEKYVIGADTAGEGSDYFCAQVLEAKSGRQAAVLRQRYDEDVFAKTLICLGRYYKNALIAIEANYSTYPIRELERLHYQNQYIREQEDNFTHRKTTAYGFRTTAVTRPLIIGNLICAAREQCELIGDEATINEMLTFIRSGAGRPEAAYGCHDDLVMSLAIAHYVRSDALQGGSFEAKAPCYNFEAERAFSERGIEKIRLI